MNLKPFNLRDFQTYIFDLDGTLYLANQMINGADKLISQLQNLDKNVYAITNNCLLSNTQYYHKLQAMKIDIARENVINSTLSVINWIKSSSFAQKEVYFFGSKNLHQQVKEDVKIKWTKSLEKAHLIVIGNNPNLSWEHLNQVAIAIQKGKPYLVANSDLRLPLGNNLYGVDTGTLGKMIETISNVSPLAILGKTYPQMLEPFICGKTIFIGDRIYTDMHCAKQANINNCLVLSGEATWKDYLKNQKNIDFVVNSIADLIDKI